MWNYVVGVVMVQIIPYSAFFGSAINLQILHATKRNTFYYLPDKHLYVCLLIIIYRNGLMANEVTGGIKCL